MRHPESMAVTQVNSRNDMTKSLLKLVQLGSDPICPKAATRQAVDRLLNRFGFSRQGEQLSELHLAKNGFFAFESALLVLPIAGVSPVPSIAAWNRKTKWRRYYLHVPKDCVFFAQDLFADQFGLTKSGVIRLDPESGTIHRHSKSLEAWARKILKDYDSETGWPAGHDWQKKHGRLPVGSRLLGKRPFVLGGKYAAANLVAVELWEAMDLLGRLYRQIKDIPDRSPVTIRGWIRSN